jgi:hypothetical protein
MAMPKMDFSKLLESIDKTSSAKKTYDDTEFWKPTKDASGSASARIRFLPSKNVEDIPYVRVFSHSFKNSETNRWYIENCPTTLGSDHECPLCQANTLLWQTNDEDKKKVASARKRKLSYISNILIIKDAGNPENNGKVMRYKYGQKIFDKIVAVAKPDEMSDESPINPFDVYEGADFLLKMVKANDQFNYDQSKFMNASPLFNGDDDKIEEVVSNCFDINIEAAPEKFKSLDDLQKKLLWVLGVDDGKSKVSSAKQKEFDSDDDELAKISEIVNKPAEVKKKPPMPVMKESEDDDSAFFQSLIS